jgi:hypothetical protein
MCCLCGLWLSGSFNRNILLLLEDIFAKFYRILGVTLMITLLIELQAWVDPSMQLRNCWFFLMLF